MAMDFASATRKVRNLLASSKPAQLQKSALTEDTLRDNIIREASAKSERFKSALRQQPTVQYEGVDETGQSGTLEYEWDTFPEALRDFARAAFGWDEPELQSRDKVRPSYRFNREMLQAAINTPAFQELRPYARNNELESLYGAITGAPDLVKMAPGVLAEHIARSEQMSEAERDQQSAEDMFEQLRQRARQEISQDGQVSGQTKGDISRALRKGRRAGERLEQLMQAESQSSMVVDAIAAGEALAQAAKDGIEALGAVPGIGGGESHNLTPDQQIALAEKWAQNPDMRGVVRMLGRMLRSMTFKRHARTKNVNIEPVGVTTGNDLRLLLPHELARGFSANKLIKTAFIKDYAQRSLLQYDMEGKAPAGKGPIIVVHDGSGSMSGERFVWATSLCLSVLTIANREKRHFAGAEFGSAGQLRSWLFAKDKAPDPEQVLDYATHFFGGGTSTLTGMRWALDVMKAQPQFRSADVLLVGDGQDYFREDDKRVRDELRALGCRIHGISIMCPNNTYMGQMCQTVVDVQDLAGANDATDHIAQNIT